MNISIPKIMGKEVALPGIKDIAKGLVLVALARCEVFGMWPVGIAYAAAILPQNPYVAFIGLCLGMTNAGVLGVRYVLAFFLYYMLCFGKKITSEKKQAFIIGMSTLFFSGIVLLFLGINAVEATKLGAEAVVVGGLFFLFTFLETKSPVSALGEMIIFGSALGGIHGAVIPYVNVSLSAFCAIFTALSFAYACELTLAALASGILAFIMSVGSGDAVLFFGAFSICGALGAMLSGYGKPGVIAGFLCGISISVLYCGALHNAGIFDIFAPLVAFAVLPEHIHYRISGFINRRFEIRYSEAEHENTVATQLKTVARAVCGLADGVTEKADNTAADAKEIFDRVKARVCADCSLAETCCKQEKNSNNMDKIWQTMEESGFCNLTNMPLGFSQTCIRAERFLTEFGHLYELYKQNAISKGATRSSREIIARQYGEISKAIELLSAKIETGEDENQDAERIFSPKITVRTEPKQGQSISGDTVIYFERANKFFVILCDGMGSGSDAMHQSRLVARLFEKFLKAGFDKDTALRMINSALSLKADQESFSTVDLLEIDTATGECEFLKIGSAQSFAKNKKEISVISSASLPIGILDNINAEPVKYKAESGDIIVMVSDGVGEAGNGVLKSDWIKKVLLLEKRKPREIADLIIEGAKARAKFSDDMTCCVIKIEKRKEG